MTTNTAKKLVLSTVAFAIVSALTYVSAAGAPTHSPYDTGLGDSLNMDTTLVIGAVLYGVGVILTSSSKAIIAKFGTRFLR